MSTETFVGCDPHKLTVTLAAVDAVGVEVEVVHYDNTAAGLAEALVWLGGLGPVVRFGIEGSAGHGRHLAVAAVEVGFDVREVPARRTAQRRRDRRRPKTDREDALAIARATAGDPALGPARACHQDPVTEEIKAVGDWRDEFVERRKRLLNRTESLLGTLPVGLLDVTGRSGGVIARARRAVAAGDDIALDRAAHRRLEHLADIIADHEELTGRIKGLESDLRRLVTESGSSLCEEIGVATVIAAWLLVEVGDPSRFRTEAAFARWCGVAAVATSSGEAHGEPTRHRLWFASDFAAEDHRRK